MKYIVNVSGGLTSYEALRRTIEKHGKENTDAIFADTLIEDEDGETDLHKAFLCIQHGFTQAGGQIDFQRRRNLHRLEP